MIGTVILKPTKLCNADCSYCCAPPDGAGMWDLNRFRRYFDRLAPALSPSPVVLWHGGEPMLLGPEFYERALEYARSKVPGVRFSMQTNLLLYSTARWQRIFVDVFGGSFSTSFDPDGERRSLKGDTQAYQTRFLRKLDEVLADGLRPLVIGTYNQATIHLAESVYEKSLSYGEKAFSIRINYMHPTGRIAGLGGLIQPRHYGGALTAIYDRWIKEMPNFDITPLDLMVKRVVGLDSDRCPWTKSCGGRFLSIEPNGDAYNCGEYADLGDRRQCFGNLEKQSVEEMLRSPPAVMIRRRRVSVPLECQTCRHFEQCEGGCSRDSALFGNGVLGKFHYCGAWMMIFDRIKESIASGEADSLLKRYGVDPSWARRRVA